METIEYRKKIDEAYNTDQSVLFRWKQTEKFLEPKELLSAGLDIGERTALTKRLEDLYNINFDSTNIDLDIEPLKGEYDIITSFEVLEHLFNPLFNLIEIKRVLKPNGVLYISYFPSESSISSLNPITSVNICLVESAIIPTCST